MHTGCDRPVNGGPRKPEGSAFFRISPYQKPFADPRQTPSLFAFERFEPTCLATRRKPSGTRPAASMATESTISHGSAETDKRCCCFVLFLKGSTPDLR